MAQRAVMMDVLELVPAKERSTFAKALVKQDELDTIQLLSDLGYLNKSSFEGKTDPASLQAAIFQFRVECRLADGNATNFGEMSQNIALPAGEKEATKLTQEELILLKNLAGLEGELVFYAFPTQVDICCRVAFYRFRVYSLIAPNLVPKSHLLAEQVQKLQEVLAQYKFDGGLVDFLNILGEQHRLSEFCKHSRFSLEGFIGPVFFFEVKDKNARKFNQLTVEKVKLTKPKDFLKGITNKKLEEAVEKVIRQAPQSHLNNYIQSHENRFILRVLQVKLWVMGLYQGKLDHDFGPLSLEALLEFLQLTFQAGEKGEEDLQRILHVINKNQCVINFQYLLDTHILRIEQQNETDNTFEAYYQLLEGEFMQHEDANVREKAGTLDQEIKACLIQHTEKLSGVKTPDRIYKGKKGIRKFISGIVSSIKDGLEKLADFIRKLVSWISKSIKFVFEEIKEALLTFRRGLTFLFGKRKIKTSASIYADYDFDFDGHTVLQATTDHELLIMHSGAVRAHAEALFPTIRFAVEVVRWGIRFATGMAWVKVLLKMAELLRKMVIKALT